MKIHEPTKKEVFEALKLDGCTWCGGCGCECTARINMYTCFEIAKERLTVKQYTAEEIEEQKKKAKETPNAADEAFNYFWEYINT